MKHNTRQPGIAAALIFMIIGLCAGSAWADTLELLSGAKSEGKVVSRDDKAIKFGTKIGTMQITRDYPLSAIHAITIDGKREVVNEKTDAPREPVAPRTPATPFRPTPPADAAPAADDAPATPATDADGRPKRTAAEVRALIQRVGATPPDWYEAEPLNYPKTLDMSWAKPQGKGWNTQKNIGQYMWSVINENPSRWKQGTKFIHHVLTVNKGNREAQVQAMRELGHCYHDLLRDWARAAFWYEQAQKAGANVPETDLAHCYWELGCKEMAVSILQRIRLDNTRYGAVIKQWSDMGELNRAIKLADATARAGNPVGAYMGAADACKRHGRFREAIAYYQKMLALPQSTTRKDVMDRNRKRAQASIDNIKAVELLDPSRIPDGSYTGNAMSYAGDMQVEVKVAGGKITNIRIARHKDKQFFTALTDTPEKIIEKQSLKGIDTVTGATVTSDAVINATAAALFDKMK